MVESARGYYSPLRAIELQMLMLLMMMTVVVVVVVISLITKHFLWEMLF
jgi:hypothetical protein